MKQSKLIIERRYANLREDYSNGKITLSEFHKILTRHGYSPKMIDSIVNGVLDFSKKDLMRLFKTDVGNYSIKMFMNHVSKYPSNYRVLMINYLRYYKISYDFIFKVVDKYYDNNMDKIKLRPDIDKGDFFEALSNLLTEYTFAKPHEIVDIIYDNFDTELRISSINTYRKM